VIVMRILSVGIVLLVLMVAVGLIVAEPKHVDGGWHRSDGVPEESPTIVPADDTQTSPMTTTEAQGGGIVSVSLLVTIAMVLFGIVFVKVLTIVMRKKRSRQ